MEVAKPVSTNISVSTGLVVLTLLLIGTWSPQAFSASWSKSDCKESAEEIQPEMTLDDLTLDPVDHSAIESASTEIDEGAVADATNEQITPFLYLAPRVASVIKDVFGDHRDHAEPEDGHSSPLAESENGAPYPRPVDSDLPETGELGETSVPLLQRQMYRIDI